MTRLRHLENYEVAMLMLFSDEKVVTYEETISSIESDKWEKAIQQEITALLENENWTYEKRLNNCKVIDCKWAFKRMISRNCDFIQGQIIG